MQVKIEFTGGRGMKVATMSNGRLVVTRVPNQGLQGYFRPVNGRAQVWVPCGKYRSQAEVQDALIAAWKDMAGIGVDRSRFMN